ncbi:MAG: ATPase [marine bacterium B5-7]|nr:MAG: ATPase [marine bacterium B5-7]
MLSKILETQKIILEDFQATPFFARDCFADFHLDNQITGLMGSRGIGKTTFLLHAAIQADALSGNAVYLSADSFHLSTGGLLALADQLYKETDCRMLCIDEIHKYPNWQQELKNIADTYRQFKILFTSSSMIDIVSSAYDLSRRVTLHHLYGLSFREYLAFYHDIHCPRITLDELLTSHISIANALKVPQLLKHFHHYFSFGYYPFFKIFTHNFGKTQAIENATQKTIYEDIATLHNLRTPTLLVIEKLFQYITHSLPGEMSVSKLASHLGKDFDSVSTYLDYLEKSGLIHCLYPMQSGKARLRNPLKMYPENSNLIYTSIRAEKDDAVIGKVRETFAINQLHNAGHAVFYSKVGDIQIKEAIFEIGGRNKTDKQIKGVYNAYVLADGILSGNKNIIPLFLLGLLG